MNALYPALLVGAVGIAYLSYSKQNSAMEMPTGYWSSLLNIGTKIGIGTSAMDKQPNPSAIKNPVCMITDKDSYIGYLIGQGKQEYADTVNGYDDAMWRAEVNVLQDNAQCWLSLT